MGHKPLKVQMMQWSMGSCCSSFASNSRDSNSAPLPWLRGSKDPPNPALQTFVPPPQHRMYPSVNYCLA